MKVLAVIFGIILILFTALMYCCLKISGECSRDEEERDEADNL